MDFETARRVLLVASLEEADKAGELVPVDLRRRSTEAAADPGSAVDEATFSDAEEQFLASRAEVVMKDLPSFERAGVASVMLRRGGWVLVVAMLVIGFFSKELGPSGVVNILAFPLLGLMAWNLLVYGWMGVNRLISGGGANGLGDRVSNALEPKDDGPGAVFAKRWARVAAPVFGARASGWLHLGAAALAIGAVAAMYYQGLVRDYQATWESTFLSPQNVHSLLSVALAPATWVPGLALPDVGGIESIQAPGEETAAAWIHRYALAVGLVVIVPRLILAILSGARARRLGGALPVREEAPIYFKTLLAEKRGAKTVVRVIPHRLELDSRERDALRERLHAHWGGSLWMDFLEPVAYGDEEEFSERAAELVKSDHVTVVCGLSATPEDESQGRLMRAVSAARAGGDVLLVLQDGDFTGRFGEARATERRAAWEKLAGECRIPVLNENS